MKHVHSIIILCMFVFFAVSFVGPNPAVAASAAEISRDAANSLQKLYAKSSAAKAMSEKAKAILKASDIVFVNGGDVEEGMRVLDEREMSGFLRRLYRSGKPFLGVSAGSIMLARKWVCWRDPDNDESAETFSCLGLAPILCDTHGEGERWDELKALLTLSPMGAIGHGIPSGTAIVVEPDRTLSVLGGEVDRFRKRTIGIVQIKGLVPDKNAQ